MKMIKNLTLAAAAIAVTLLFQTPITRANDDGRYHRNATVTWTKWVTEWIANDGETGIFATIAGPAGGDIGDGTLTGEALNPIDSLPGGAVTFEADYHFDGSKHSFTVHFVVTQQAPNAEGVIFGVVEGVVTDGWLKGNHVLGKYSSRPCEAGEGLGLSPCFDGTAVLRVRSEVRGRMGNPQKP